jgi:hypothetical protein
LYFCRYIISYVVYYNCKTEKINPKSIKYMLGMSDIAIG